MFNRYLGKGNWTTLMDEYGNLRIVCACDSTTSLKTTSVYGHSKSKKHQGFITGITNLKSRSESCRKVGGVVKRRGHDVETLFNITFNQMAISSHNRPTSDSCIESKKLLTKLYDRLGVHGGYVSIKSGNNIQFTLGRIPEIESRTDPLETFRNRKECRRIFLRYLKKIYSECPSDILVYKFHDSWVFFNMDSVIEFIVSNGRWRRLESGRFKCDFYDRRRDGYRQFLTCEYRRTHKGLFLGANGNRGLPFIELLMDSIDYWKEPIRN